MLETLASDKYSSLLGPFLTYEENEELWIRNLCLALLKFYYRKGMLKFAAYVTIIIYAIS
jgi:hypothetical protein